jgi:hypothetical protein
MSEHDGQHDRIDPVPMPVDCNANGDIFGNSLAPSIYPLQNSIQTVMSISQAMPGSHCLQYPLD